MSSHGVLPEIFVLKMLGPVKPHHSDEDNYDDASMRTIQHPLYDTKVLLEIGDYFSPRIIEYSFSKRPTSYNMVNLDIKNNIIPFKDDYYLGYDFTGALSIYDSKFELVVRNTAFQKSISDVKYHSSSDLLIIVDYYGFTVCRLSIENGLETLYCKENDSIYNITIEVTSYDQIICIERNGPVRMYDLYTGKQLGEILGEPNSTCCVNPFTGDIYFAQEGIITVCNSQGKHIRNIYNHGGRHIFRQQIARMKILYGKYLAVFFSLASEYRTQIFNPDGTFMTYFTKCDNIIPTKYGGFLLKYGGTRFYVHIA